MCSIIEHNVIEAITIIFMWQSQKTNISLEGVIEIQTAITKVAMALKFTVHVVQSFIKGRRKSGMISISPLTVE